MDIINKKMLNTKKHLNHNSVIITNNILIVFMHAICPTKKNSICTRQTALIIQMLTISVISSSEIYNQ